MKINILKNTDVKSLIRYISFLLILSFAVSFFDVPAQAGSVTPGSMIDNIKDEVSSFPFSDSDEIISKRRVLGVKVKNLSSYKAFQKTTGSKDSSSEYILFVGKAKSSAKAKTSLSALKKYVKSEKENMENYLSASGKDIFKNARAGRSGKWIWVLMTGSKDNNDQASKAIKDSI